MNKLLLIVAMTICVTGCTPVKPWQKGKLASPQMNASSNNERSFRQHQYNSKEGSFGRMGGGIGSCGCN